MEATQTQHPRRVQQTQQTRGLRLEDGAAIFYLDYNDREWVIYLTREFLANMRERGRSDEAIIRGKLDRIADLARDEIDQLARTLEGEVTIFLGSRCRLD